MFQPIVATLILLRYWIISTSSVAAAVTVCLVGFHHFCLVVFIAFEPRRNIQHLISRKCQTVYFSSVDRDVLRLLSFQIALLHIFASLVHQATISFFSFEGDCFCRLQSLSRGDYIFILFINN